MMDEETTMTDEEESIRLANASNVNLLSGSGSSSKEELPISISSVCECLLQSHLSINQEFEGQCQHPYVKLREYDRLELTEREFAGYCTDRIVEVGHSCLDRSPQPGNFILASCNLSRRNLMKIDVLEFHQFLQFLDLSRNRLTSLKPLSNLHFLKYLNASHNLLTHVFDFDAITDLMYVDVSFNLIDEIDDLSPFWSLVNLNLSNNLITEINGLENLRYLRKLDLSHNKISHFHRLNYVNLEELYLDFNDISTFILTEKLGLHTLWHLRLLSISHNKLNTLALLKGLRSIETINFQHNDVVNVIELVHLSNLSYLTSFSIANNPITQNARFRQLTMHCIKRLEYLDGVLISPVEKGEASYICTYDYDKRAAHDNAILEILRHLNTPHIDAHIIPCYDKTVSIVLLVGPIAVRKRAIINKLRQLYPKYVKVGVSYTTRPRRTYEVDGREYHFVTDDDINKMLARGMLMSCAQRHGYHYAISFDEIKKVTQEVGVLFFHCNFATAMQVRSKYMNCKLVLAMVRNEQMHKRWLYQKYQCTPWLGSKVKAFQISLKPYESQHINYLKEDYDFCTTILDNILSSVHVVNKPGDGQPDSDQSVAERASVKSERLSDSGSYDARVKKVSDVRFSDDYDDFPDKHKIRKKSTVTFAAQDVPAFYSEEFVPHDGGVADDDNDEPSGMHPRSISEAYVNAGHRKSSENFMLSRLSSSNVQYTGGDLRHKSGSFYDSDSIAHSCSSYLNTNSDFDFIRSISQAVDDVAEFTDVFMLARLSSTGIVPTDELSQMSSDESLVQTASNILKDHVKSNEFLLCQASQTDNLTINENLYYSDVFISDQLSKRDHYMKSYIKNPGLYVAIIHTDEVDKSIKKMRTILKSCVAYQRKVNRPEMSSYNDDFIDQTLLEDRINSVYALMK